MPVVAVMSPKGGVGKTTLTANLASLLGAAQPQGQRVLAVDLDPQNALRFHHRMSAKDGRGLTPAALGTGKTQLKTVLNDAIYEGPYRVDCMPYGVTTEAQRQRFESMLAKRPEWLAQVLAKTKRELVLIDTPPGPTVYMRQALGAADLIFVVLLADAASFATLEAMNRYLKDYCPSKKQRPQLHYIINQVDTAKALNRDVVTVLGRSLDQKSQLFQVHYDSAVEEALACHQPLPLYNPDSVAAHDLGEIAQWLKMQ